MSQPPQKDVEERLARNRAELERVLAERARRAGGPSMQETKSKGLNLAAAPWKPPAPVGAPVPHANLQHTVFDDGFDEDDEDWDDDPYYDEEDDIDAELDAFEAEIESQRPAPSVAPPPAQAQTQKKDAGAGITQPAALPPASEFEILRLAKLGDLEGLRNFEAERGVSLASVEDNNKRNVLHFAADSGDVNLIQYVLEVARVPFRPDANGVTPYHIATLCRHEKAAQFFERVPGLAIQHCTAAELLEQFAPKPPGLVFSKPFAGVSVSPMNRKFWGCNAAPSTDKDLGVQVIPRCTEFPFEDAQHIFNSAAVNSSHLDSLCVPFPSVRQLKSLFARIVHVGAFDVPTSEILGLMSVIRLGPNRVATSGKPPASLGDTVLFANLTVKRDPNAARPKGFVARTMLGFTAASLKEAGVVAGWFHTPQKLPFPSVATLKYYRRFVQPHPLFDSPTRSLLFPDYDTFETVTRSDIIVKGMLIASPDIQNVWKKLDAELEDDADLQHIVNFLNAQCAAQFAVSVVWDVANFRSAFCRLGLSVHAKTNGSTSTITDLMIFRTRVFREDEQMVLSVLVASAFTTVPGSQRLLHASQIGFELGAHVIYATNTFGVSEQDLRVGFFEEVRGAAEFLYCASSSKTSAVSGSIAAAGIAIPFMLA